MVHVLTNHNFQCIMKSIMINDFAYSGILLGQKLETTIS